MSQDMHKHDESYLKLFTIEDICYLSSESPNILETFDENKVYVTIWPFYSIKYFI